jgi:hypothetical protein
MPTRKLGITVAPNQGDSRLKQRIEVRKAQAPPPKEAPATKQERSSFFSTLGDAIPVGESSLFGLMTSSTPPPAKKPSGRSSAKAARQTAQSEPRATPPSVSGAASMLPAWALSASEILSRDETLYSAYSKKPAPKPPPGPTIKVMMDTFDEDKDEQQPKPASSFFGNYDSYFAMPEELMNAIASPLRNPATGSPRASVSRPAKPPTAGAAGNSNSSVSRGESNRSPGRGSRSRSRATVVESPRLASGLTAAEELERAMSHRPMNPFVHGDGTGTKALSVMVNHNTVHLSTNSWKGRGDPAGGTLSGSTKPSPQAWEKYEGRRFKKVAFAIHNEEKRIAENVKKGGFLAPQSYQTSYERRLTYRGLAAAH